MRFQMWATLIALTAALSACAAMNRPLPDGYTGTTATLADSTNSIRGATCGSLTSCSNRCKTT